MSFHDDLLNEYSFPDEDGIDDYGDEDDMETEQPEPEQPKQQGPRRELLALPLINTEGTQLRVSGLDQNTVAEYTEVLNAAWKEAQEKAQNEGGDVLEMMHFPFPPIDVFFDGKDYWPADGHHRTAAFKACGIPVIPAIIHDGDKNKAILTACGANESHGLRRNQKDRINSIAAALRLENESGFTWSDRHIATICKVSPTTVGNVRRQLKEAEAYKTKPADSKGQVSKVDSSTQAKAEPIKRVGKDGKIRDASSNAKSGQNKAQKAESTRNADLNWANNLPLRSKLVGPTGEPDGSTPLEKFLADALLFKQIERNQNFQELVTWLSKNDMLDGSGTSPLQTFLHNFIYLNNPRAWKLCEHCEGSGCDECGGAGYKLS